MLCFFAMVNKLLDLIIYKGFDGRITYTCAQEYKLIRFNERKQINDILPPMEWTYARVICICYCTTDTCLATYQGKDTELCHLVAMMKFNGSLPLEGKRLILRHLSYWTLDLRFGQGFLQFYQVGECLKEWQSPTQKPLKLWWWRQHLREPNRIIVVEVTSWLEYTR